MINQEIIKKTEDFLKRKFDEGAYLNSHPKDKAYRLEHSYRVANIGRMIAEKEGFDETELTVACLLHDVAYCLEFGENGWKEHGRWSSDIARPFLAELGFAKDRIEDMCYGIATHVDDVADFSGESTPFSLSVGDADNLDRFDVLRIHETLCKDGFTDLNIDDKILYVKKRILRLRELSEMPLGTKTAEMMWKERLSFYISFYNKLENQFESSRYILNLT